MAAENVQAEVIENIERLEVELKELIRKRDQMTNPPDRQVLDQEIRDLEAELKYLQTRLA
ncbi:MAG: hypothetical protein PHU85_18255 [Phycisphaerae bacterium]|nr:hypothetical protein [Phycisphaerae bacterium]